MAHWFTADPHFGHKNIIEFCDRPYASVEEMNAGLLDHLIQTVGEDDDLWILGDFCFPTNAASKAEIRRIFEAIPGRKHLIIGNHDHSFTKDLGWDSVQDYIELEDGDQTFVLSHYPMVTWNGIRQGAVQLFGHVHDLWLGSRNCVNVGVDLWDYAPVDASRILATAKVLPVQDMTRQLEPGFSFD